MEHTIRAYDEGRDLDHLLRCWHEIGWIESVEKREALRWFLSSNNVEVAEIGGEAEAMTAWAPSSVRYQDTDLPMSAVSAVTVSHVARKLGLASRLTARSLRTAAEAGQAVAALGVFEQGFYDRVGFGLGSYDHELTFDPAALKVDHVPYRPPVRLTPEDHVEICRALCGRMLGHGAMSLYPEGIIRAEMLFPDRLFALGYRDGDGTLTHLVLGEMLGEYGPFRVNAIGYRTAHELLELLRMLKELGDQVRTIRMIEPAEVQLEALLREPFRERDRTRGAPAHQSGHRAMAWWQLRILDVGACVAAREVDGEPVRFNLSLTDPAGAYLDGGWEGVAGDYTITIGDPSSATRGHTAGLPSMATDVGSFTRLWFGVRPASVLVTTDPIDAPADLIARLDTALALPVPRPGWNF